MLFRRVLLLLSLTVDSTLNSTLNRRLLELRQRLQSDAAATGFLANQKRAGIEICPRGCCVPASAPKRAARSHDIELKATFAV